MELWPLAFSDKNNKTQWFDESFEKLFEFFDIFGQLSRGELPIEAKIVEHAILCLPTLWYLCVAIASGVVGSPGGS